MKDPRKLSSEKRALVLSIDQFGAVHGVKVRLRPTRRATIVASIKKMDKSIYE